MNETLFDAQMSIRGTFVPSGDAVYALLARRLTFEPSAIPFLIQHRLCAGSVLLHINLRSNLWLARNLYPLWRVVQERFRLN